MNRKLLLYFRWKVASRPLFKGRLLGLVCVATLGICPVAWGQCTSELQAIKEGRRKELINSGLRDGVNGWNFQENSSEYASEHVKRIDDYFNEGLRRARTLCARSSAIECSRYLDGVIENQKRSNEREIRHAKEYGPSDPKIVPQKDYYICRAERLIQELQALGSGINRSDSQGVAGRQESDSLGQNQGKEQKILGEQPLALARQNQSHGDEQAKKDKRKRHDATYEAHQCLTPTDFDNPRSYGGMQNNCSFKVSFNFCVYRPKPSSWATAFDCEKQSFGGATAAAGGKGFGHMKGGESVHVFACREPALVLDTRFIAGAGRVEGRCRKIGD